MRTEQQAKRAHARRMELPLPYSRESVHAGLALCGLAALVLGFVLCGTGGEVGWCQDHPDDDGYHMDASRDCPSILRDATGFEMFAGTVWMWLVLGGVLALIVAGVVWVRHQLS